MVPHATIYSATALYDLAFSYRDCAAESAFLRELYRRRRGRAPSSFLELAAGPARHAIEMLASGLEVLALDIAPEMAVYARRVAAGRKLELPCLTADMVAFASPRSFDFAACLLCSASYLLTDDAVLSHFQCVHAALVAGGMYLLELTHPAELLGSRKSAETWTMRDATGTLDIAWRGDPSTASDGIWESQVTLLYRPFDGSAPISIEDTARQRGFTLAELTRFAERAGFIVEGTLGAFDENLTLDDPKAQRMIAILRKR